LPGRCFNTPPATPAEDQAERNGVERLERFLEDQERKDRCEHRHQVDEHARPARADQGYAPPGTACAGV
jgi:hypothetical protein